MASRAADFTLITETEVERLIDLEKAYVAIEASYRSYSLGASRTPPTTTLELPGGRLFSFLTWLEDRSFFIAKLATVFPENRRLGRAVVQPHVFIYDAATGSLAAAIEGRHFAGVRTALSSAIAAVRLVRRPPRVATIFGTGVQGRAHVRVLAALVPSLEVINVFSRGAENRACFAREMPPPREHLAIRVVDSAADAVARTELIICATTSGAPVFDAAWLSGGEVCVVGLGAMGPKMQEIPDELMEDAFFVVDSMAEAEAYGELVGPRSRGLTVSIAGEIGAVLAERLEVPASGPVVFKHHGLPVTDAALAEALLSRLASGN